MTFKKKPWINQGFAEKEGFEPPEVWPSTVFKTAAFDHSAISPSRANIMFIDFQFVDLIDNIYDY